MLLFPSLVMPSLVMFIGRFGVALAAKRVAPKTSLGTLILAAQFLDFLWPALSRPAIPEFHLWISPTIPSRTAC